VLGNLNRRPRIFPDYKRSSMSFFHFTKRAAVLLFPLFCAEPFLAQQKPPHACFEQPNAAKEAIRRLPESGSQMMPFTSLRRKNVARFCT